MNAPPDNRIASAAEQGRNRVMATGWSPRVDVRESMRRLDEWVRDAQPASTTSTAVAARPRPPAAIKGRG